MQVLDKGNLPHLLLVHIADYCRHLVESGHFRRTETAFSCYYPVPFARFFDDDGLNYAVFAYACRELTKLSLIKFPSGLLGIIIYKVDRDCVYAVFLRRIAAEECAETFTECHFMLPFPFRDCLRPHPQGSYTPLRLRSEDHTA